MVELRADDLGMHWPSNTFVKLVNANWQLRSPSDTDGEDEFSGSETVDSIDGCTEKDVG